MPKNENHNPSWGGDRRSAEFRSGKQAKRVLKSVNPQRVVGLSIFVPVNLKVRYDALNDEQRQQVRERVALEITRALDAL